MSGKYERIAIRGAKRSIITPAFKMVVGLCIAGFILGFAIMYSNIK